MGSARSGEGGCLTIRSEFVADGISISVSDDGVGLLARPKQPNERSTSVGVENVSNHLRTAYGGRASFTLRPRRGGGTEALISLSRVKLIKPYDRSTFVLTMADTDETELLVSERQAKELRQLFPGL